MKRLFAERRVVRAEVIVGIKNGVERHLAKLVIGHRRVPSFLWALVDADAERAKRRLKLIRDKLLERVNHRAVRSRRHARIRRHAALTRGDSATTTMNHVAGSGTPAP